MSPHTRGLALGMSIGTLVGIVVGVTAALLLFGALT